MDTAAPDLKQHIPHPPLAIQRPQLLGKLNTALRYRLTLISAPPGYGKTTIASQFAAQAPCPVVWHTVEERERDLPNLHNHCLSLFEHLAQGITASSPGSDGVPPSELADHIADYLRQSQIRDLIYVLDDVHFLDGLPSCESWLRTLQHRLPKSCHLMLISRTLPNLPYVEMAARSEILTVGPDELRLKPDEVNQLAEEISGGSINLSEIQALLARLDGWPAGVLLAVQPMPDGLTASMFGEGTASEALFEALARVMLRAQPPDLRNFLLDSSTLPYLTISLCENVLNLTHSAELLAVVQARNLFLLNLAGTLQYHVLFQNFLQRELCNTHPERFADLHLRAARWFEEVDDVERAFPHYIKAGRESEALRLAEKTARAFFGQGRFNAMLDWNRQLSEAGILAPNLSLECSMIHTDRYEYEAAESELTRAERGFKKDSDKTGLATVQLQRAMICQQRGEYRKALSLAEAIANLDEDILRGRTLRIIGFAHLQLGDSVAAVKHLEDAVKLYRKVGLVSSLSHLLQDLHWAYFRLGKLDEMGSCLQEAVALRRSLRGAGALALALNVLGFYFHKRGNYLQALSTFEEGLQLIAGTGDRRAEGFLLGSMADLKRDLGLYVSAQAYYDKALQIVRPETDPSLYSAILIGIATLRRWQARPGEALSLAEEALQIAQDHLLAFEAAMAEAAVLQARAMTDDPRQALDQLNCVVADLEERRAYFELIEVLGGCARLADLCGDEQATADYLRPALLLAKGVGTTETLAVEIARAPSLEAITAQMPEAVQLRADLGVLREAQTQVKEDAHPGSGAPRQDMPELSVLTLGRERVVRDGKVISVRQWQAAAPRELFFYLLFNGPKSRPDIELEFWPESNPEQVRSLFHTTLHRARAALGSNVVVFDDEMYSINSRLKIDCDAHQLESWTTQARLLPPRDARADDLWRKALSLYQGDFLHSIDKNWVAARREAYHAMYVDALLGLGRCARARNDHSAAVEWFSKALAANPYSEYLYQQMIECFALMGETGKVQACFHNLKTLLSDELGIEPSEETLKLVRRVAGNL